MTRSDFVENAENVTLCDPLPYISLFTMILSPAQETERNTLWQSRSPAYKKNSNSYSLSYSYNDECLKGTLSTSGRILFCPELIRLKEMYICLLLQVPNTFGSTLTKVLIANRSDSILRLNADPLRTRNGKQKNTVRVNCRSKFVKYSSSFDLTFTHTFHINLYSLKVRGFWQRDHQRFWHVYTQAT